MRRLGLYVHIPFCQKKCSYCDFYSLSYAEECESEYISALCRHIEAEQELYKDCEFDTVYFGGGTPSVLSPESFFKLADFIRTHLKISDSAEFTVEVNPGTLNREKLTTFKKAGVNRLSMGLQSTSNSELSVLGRIHSLSSFEENYRLARELGFDNISVDIMYGLPDQKLDDFSKTLDHVCKFAPEHISAYCLKIEENTPFGRMQDKLQLPNDEEECEMYMLLCQFLEKHGYKQYEISNFARAGRFSRHNMKYWLSEEYVAFGPSAHSYLNGKRYSYPRDINKYIFETKNSTPKRIYEDEAEPEISMSKMDEYVMLKLRLSNGIDENEFEKMFGVTFEEEYPNIEKFVKSGHVVRQNGKIFFSSQGFFVSNYILTELLH